MGHQRSNRFDISLIVNLLLLICGDVHPNPGPVRNADLKIILLNLCSLRDKLDILQAELEPYDVICITEAWLHPGVDSIDIKIPGFHLPLRKDRHSRGGGVAVYIKSYLSFECMNDLDLPALEAI